jgi:hypothetical protein
MARSKRRLLPVSLPPYLNCHSERSDPAFSCAPVRGAPGHAVEEPLFASPFFVFSPPHPVISNGAGRLFLSASLQRIGRPADVRNLSSSFLVLRREDLRTIAANLAATNLSSLPIPPVTPSPPFDRNRMFSSHFSAIGAPDVCPPRKGWKRLCKVRSARLHMASVQPGLYDCSH